MTPTPAEVRRNRMLLVAIFVLFFGSLLVAGLLRFSGWRPAGMKNHGELLQPPADLRAQAPRLVDGTSYAWNPVARTWRVLVAPPGPCGDECLRVARDVEKVWELMAQDADRVDVLWLCASEPCALPAGAPHPATLRLLAPDAALRTRLPGLEAAVGTPVYVIDPNGFVILRYAPGSDPAGLRADLAKLLKLK